MDFSILGKISDIETFAVGRKIRELKRLQKRYGKGRWRKRKGSATVRLARFGGQSYTGMKRLASARRNSRSSVTWTDEHACKTPLLGRVRPQ